MPDDTTEGTETSREGIDWHWGPDPAFGNLCQHKGPRERCTGPDCEDVPDDTTEGTEFDPKPGDLWRDRDGHLWFAMEEQSGDFDDPDLVCENGQRGYPNDVESQFGPLVRFQTGTEPSKADQQMGVMDTPELAELFVAAVNAGQDGFVPWCVFCRRPVIAHQGDLCGAKAGEPAPERTPPDDTTRAPGRCHDEAPGPLGTGLYCSRLTGHDGDHGSGGFRWASTATPPDDTTPIGKIMTTTIPQQLEEADWAHTYDGVRIWELGEDGDLLMTVGHIDRDVFAKACDAYAREIWSYSPAEAVDEGLTQIAGDSTHETARIVDPSDFPYYDFEVKFGEGDLPVTVWRAG